VTAILHELAAAALAALAREGTSDDGTWRAVDLRDDLPIEITCRGPDLPGAIEPTIATAEQVFRNRPWTGTYRLVVRASRLIVLDLYWTPGESTRVMGFSRGDWEQGLLAKT
jgi:hypothetical protein